MPIRAAVAQKNYRTCAQHGGQQSIKKRTLKAFWLRKLGLYETSTIPRVAISVGATGVARSCQEDRPPGARSVEAPGPSVLQAVA